MSKELQVDTARIEGSDLFDRAWYLRRYPDVAAAGIDPVQHYLQHGAAEGRNPSPRFDTNWYLAQNRDVRDSGMNPLVHFLGFGRDEGRKPGPDWGIPADICHQVKIYQSLRVQGRQRLAVCTAIFGAYETLMLPDRIDPEVDYVCFTDGEPNGCGVWQRREAPFHHADPRRVARYVKTHLAELLSDFDYAVWIDGNVVVRGDVKKYVEAISRSGAALGMVAHVVRDCVYEEAEACKAAGKDAADLIDAQIERYRRAAVPRHGGLFATSFYVVHIKHPLTREFYQLWWQEIESNSCRDQLSVGWALNLSKIPHCHVLPAGKWAGNHPDFSKFTHEEVRTFVVPDALAKLGQHDNIVPAAVRRACRGGTEAV